MTWGAAIEVPLKEITPPPSLSETMSTPGAMNLTCEPRLEKDANWSSASDAATAGGFTLNRDQIVLNHPIKALGLHSVPVHLHPEVDVKITINVARSAEEAERQARGESTTASREEASMDDLGLEVGAALAEAGDVEM